MLIVTDTFESFTILKIRAAGFVEEPIGIYEPVKVALSMLCRGAYFMIVLCDVMGNTLVDYQIVDR